mgnify:FL=1
MEIGRIIWYNDWQGQFEVGWYAHIQADFARQNCGLAGAAKDWMRNVRILTFRA